MINWGDWSQMPDYRQFQNQNKGKSPVGQLARVFDPMTAIPGVNQIANPIHDAGTASIEAGNRALSPVVKGAHALTDFITPGHKQIRDQVPALQNINRFAETNPVDTAAIIVGSIFSGGALGGAAGGAGAGGATAGTYGAGGAGALGAGSSGALGAGGASALGSALPTASSFFGPQLAAGGAGAAGGIGGGAAGATGAGAAGSVLPTASAFFGPELAGTGAGVSPGLLSSLKSAYATAKPFIKGAQIGGRVNDFAGPDTERMGRYAQQRLLAERIKNDQINPELPNTPMERAKMSEERQKMLARLMMGQRFFGSAY